MGCNCNKKTRTTWTRREAQRRAGRATTFETETVDPAPTEPVDSKE